MTPGPYLTHVQVFQSQGYVTLLPEIGDARLKRPHTVGGQLRSLSLLQSGKSVP